MATSPSWRPSRSPSTVREAPPHRCETCTKHYGHGKKVCKVLVEPAGLAGECWAWSDDPDWLEKAEASISAYSQSGRWRNSEIWRTRRTGPRIHGSEADPSERDR